MVNGILITNQGEAIELAEILTPEVVSTAMNTTEFVMRSFDYGINAYVSDEQFSGREHNALGYMVAVSLAVDTNQDIFYGSILFFGTVTNEGVELSLTEDQVFNIRGEVCDSYRFMALDDEAIDRLGVDILKD